MTLACGCERVRWGVGSLSNNGRFWKPDASKHVYVWLDFNQCNSVSQNPEFHPRSIFSLGGC